jgi:hypothetical protein
MAVTALGVMVDKYLYFDDLISLHIFPHRVQNPNMVNRQNDEVQQVHHIMCQNSLSFGIGITMRNPRDNRRRCRRWNQKTSLFLCWRSTAEKIVYIFLQDFPKKKTLSILVSCRFFICITDEILRTLLLMHDGISFGKILPKQVCYFGAWMNWK